MQQIKESLSLYEIYDTSVSSNNENDRSEIILAVGQHSKKELQILADSARIHGQLFYHISDHLELEDLISSPARIGPIMALEYKPSPLEGWWSVIKRVFDFFVSGALILILSPVLLLVAIGIKLDSK